MARRRDVRFFEAMLRGAVGEALFVAPWGYASRSTAYGYAFRFTDGPYETLAPCEASTLHGAVSACIATASAQRAEGERADAPSVNSNAAGAPSGESR